MSGCLDNIHCECGFEMGEKRNAVAAVVSGTLFFVGWWVTIDCSAMNMNGWNNLYHIVAVVGTIAFFMVNAVSNSQVRGEAMTEGVLGTKGARVWLLFGFALSFGALVAAMWIMFDVFARVDKTVDTWWPGVALFIANFLIFIASIVYKFGRTEDLWG